MKQLNKFWNWLFPAKLNTNKISREAAYRVSQPTLSW